MEGQYDGIYDVLLWDTVSYTRYCSISVYYGCHEKLEIKNLSFVLIALG